MTQVISTSLLGMPCDDRRPTVAFSRAAGIENPYAGKTRQNN